MNEPVTFEQVADFVRAWAVLRTNIFIQPETQFERDLGITGDDGSDLIVDAAAEFGVKLTEDSFDLGFNEFLFHSEGIDISPVIQSLFGKPMPEVRAFTVGELHNAIAQEQSKWF